MASLTMATSLAVSAATPAVALAQSSLSSVRMVPAPLALVAPLRCKTTGSRVVAMATPQGSGVQTTKKDDLDAQVRKSIEEAQEVCAADETSGECAAAWDDVEELSAEASHKRDRAQETKDPLEAFCKDNPETDECRVYED